MINILICDDEEESLQLNRKYVAEFFEKIGIDYTVYCYSESRIEDKILKSIDIAFLDIDFHDDVTGIQIAQRALTLNKWVAIIFVTCHEEYALDAFRLQVNGYLEKPINSSHMDIVLKKAYVYVKGIKNNFETSTFEFMYDRKKVVIRQKSVFHIEKINRKIVIETNESTYEVNESINSLESEMTEYFVKINSGTLINMFYITEFSKGSIYMSNGRTFRISRNRLKDVKEKYFSFTNRS